MEYLTWRLVSKPRKCKCLLEYSIMYHWKLCITSTYYLRRLRTMSMKLHSQAFIFTARIPEMISFITTSRLSVKEAAFSLSLAAFLTINIWKTTKITSIAAPTRAFQPISCHRINRLITISSGANSITPTLFKDFSIFCASLETRLIVFPDNVASSLQRRSDRTCKTQKKPTVNWTALELADRFYFINSLIFHVNYNSSAFFELLSA